MRTSLILGLALLALASPASRAADAAIYEHVLANGLRVVTLEDHSCPIIAVQVWYHVGSKDENAERTGFAHMFEHMMFRGTDRLGPEAHFEYIRASGGECNAHTAFDQTVYENEAPKEQLPMVLWLEAERMASLKVDRAGFETERAVVEEERRLGLNQPYGSVPEKLLAQVFKVHPYRWSPIGNIEHLRRATAEELLRFWETFYVPNNATLVVVGDVTHDQVEKEADKAFGWIPKCADPPRITAKEPLFDKPKTITIEETRGPVPIVAIGYRTVGQGDKDALPLELLMSIVGGGETSRLYRALVDDAEIAVLAMGAAMSLEQEGFAGAGAVLMPLSNMDKPLAMIDVELDKVKKDGVTDAELKKAKTNYLRKLVESSQTVAKKCDQLGNAALFEGGVSKLNDRPKEIEAITLDDLKRVANEYFVPERKVIVKIEPTVGGMLRTLLGGKGEAEGEEAAPKKEIAANDPGPQRMGPKASAKRPAGYPESAPVAPLEKTHVDFASQSKTLENGLRVVVVENHELPKVSVTLGFKDGEFSEPKGKPGTASMAMEMLMKGTATKSAQQIAEVLESNAIQLGANASLDSCTVSGSALKAQTTLLFKTLADVVKDPIFPEKEFGKLKRQGITGKKIGEKQPAAIADREFAKALFGTHPYGRPSGGLSGDLENLKVKDAIAWWKQYGRPDLAVLYVAGDISAQNAFDLAEALFSDWTSDGKSPGEKLDAFPPQEKTHILLVDVPGAIQSQIRVGHRGIERDDSRWFTGKVLTQIFGGAFNSRLNETIRVKKGLTYGASGGLSAQRFAGRFTVSTFSKTKTTVEAVAAILEEVKRMQNEPPSEKELSQAKSYLVGSFAGDHETPESIVSQLFGLELDGMTLDYIDRYLDGIVKTTADDVQKLAREVIDPDHLTIVVVGDASKIEEGLKAIAPVTTVDENGKPKANAETQKPKESTDDGG